MRRDKRATKTRLDLAPIIPNGLAMYLQFNKHFIFVFSTQVSYLNPSLKLSCNLSDLMFLFPQLSRIVYW